MMTCFDTVCEIKEFCDVVMHSEDTKILEFDQNQKFDKTPFVSSADLEIFIKKNWPMWE